MVEIGGMKTSLGVTIRLLFEQLGTCPSCGGTSWGLCEPCSDRPLLVSEVDDLLVVALAPHEGLLSESIRELKYGEATHRGFPLGCLLGHRLARSDGASLFAGATKLVPVPLHPGRLVERGYNQASLIARGIATGTGLEFAPDELQRSRATSAQAKLDERDRAKNAAGAFVARSGVAGAILVDDVCTTGATLGAAASAIRAAGGTVVGALTLSLSIRRASVARRLGAGPRQTSSPPLPGAEKVP